MQQASRAAEGHAQTCGYQGAASASLLPPLRRRCEQQRQVRQSVTQPVARKPIAIAVLPARAPKKRVNAPGSRKRSSEYLRRLINTMGNMCWCALHLSPARPPELGFRFRGPSRPRCPHGCISGMARDQRGASQPCRQPTPLPPPSCCCCRQLPHTPHPCQRSLLLLPAAPCSACVGKWRRSTTNEPMTRSRLTATKGWRATCLPCCRSCLQPGLVHCHAALYTAPVAVL